MSNFSKVKEFLLELEMDITTESEEDNIFVVTDENRAVCNMMIDCEGDVLVLEQHIFDLPKKNADKDAFKRLLQINRELIHGAFVLDDEGDSVIFRDTLAIENLDQNELESSVNAMGIALAEHADEFFSLAGKETEETTAAE